MSHFESIAEETRHHEMLAADELHHGEHVHVSPFWPMTIVFIALLFLTVFTALTAHYLFLGHKWNLILAMVIACVKATLVFAYFMHLRYDKPINSVVVVSSLFAVVLFIGFTLTDAAGRKIPNLKDSQYVIPGGNTHYVRGEDGSLTRVKGDGIVKKAQTDAIAAQGAPAHGGTTPISTDAPPVTPAPAGDAKPAGH